MAVTNGNIPLINRKTWQMMTPAPVNSAAGAFVVTDGTERDNLALYVVSATVQYIYHHDEDAWHQIPSLALAGTFGAGATGARARWSNSITATGGTTTSLTTTAAINGLVRGATIRFFTGTAANLGEERVVSDILLTAGGTSTIYWTTPLSSAVVNTDTFKVDKGAFYVMNAGTIAAGIFKSYDPVTGVATSLATTNLPASWGTDGRLVATTSDDVFASGTATAGAASTITNSAKTWTTNQWTNYQIRITAGTGKGQVRTIASNTGTVITVSSAWTTTPDATSVYSIEGNDDYLYLLGNNAVTMYRYSISANTWTVMAPTTARGVAPGAGMSANWAGKTGDTKWADESNIQDGRYIYSFRGAAGNALDRFDIAGGTAGAGAWGNIAYTASGETFTTGSSYALSGRYIYMRKDATNRFFKFSLRGNYIEPVSTNLYPDGAAVIGDKTWIKVYQDNGVDTLFWLYSLRNTGAELHRLLLF